MKNFKFFFLFFMASAITGTSCQEKGMPAKIPYVFKIVDSAGNNLVGDSTHLNRYNIDSIRSYIILGTFVDTSSTGFYINKNYSSGYYFEGVTDKNFDAHFLLKYNSVEEDTIRVVYGKDNINVFQNNQLIFSKYNLSQVPAVEFNILK